MIQDALDGYELTAENFVKLVDSSNSNVKVSILDSSLVLEADSATTDDVVAAKGAGYITPGMTIPEGTSLQDLVNMIFTKVLGLDGATAPKAGISGISTTTKEVGEVISSITVTASYTDGHWDNEDDWKNSYSGNQPYQLYGTSAQTYAFSGMKSVAAQAGNSITITNYEVQYGNQSETVTIVNNNSQNVPVNQNGVALQEGSANTTTTYKPYTAANVSATTSNIKGDYKYWIGYTTTPAAELTRAIVISDLTTNTGWAGSEVKYLTEAGATPYNTPQNSYATFIVPKGMTLKTVDDSFGNSVVANFTATDITGIALDNKVYTVYQEYAAAGAGIDRKNIKLN